MVKREWCEHEEKTSKYTILDYRFDSKVVKLRIQSWFCPECGLHGAETQVLDPAPPPRPIVWSSGTYPLTWTEP